ncbi:DNA polymerase epsilon subunit [Fasciola gigantica]|uniref:DNA polymerase II subunit 2 n=1 Tax=Fasciola gigantica TaxID=46835 RepID=A0A504YBU5_FASGI|nr:DNA polymerase epsilon subunit [Fasciola gigantica]
MSITKSDVDKPFKLNGLFLAPDASNYLFQIVQRVEPSKRQKVLRRLVETILRQRIDDSRITRTLCENAVNECKADRNVDTPVLFVVDAFEVPRFQYSSTLKKFVPLDSSLGQEQAKSLFPSSAFLKSFVYAHRYEVIYQRVLRHQLFSKVTGFGDSVTDGVQRGSFRIRPIEYLLASGSPIDSVIILGMLCQLREGDWHLEDPSGIIRLDLTNAIFHEGLFPEGCIVLVEGAYEDKLLRVTGMGLPPTELSDASRRVFSVSNPFGGGSAGAPAAPQDPKMHRLLTTTQAGADAMLVLLGETKLDRTGCIDQLATLFAGYSSCPPVAFVLTGNFLSPDSTGCTCSERRLILRRIIRQLITVYTNAFPVSEDSPSPPQLILVPGPEDPVTASSHILPRPGLPVDLVSDSLTNPTNPYNWLRLVSNPCRIRIYTREIVVFRAEYTRLLVRHCVHLPTIADTVSGVIDDESTQLPGDEGSQVGVIEDLDGISGTAATGRNTQQTAETATPVQTSPKTSQNSTEKLGVGLARCLASQTHLLPLLGHIAPVYWAWDQALSLNPLPNLVVAVEPNALANLNAARNLAQTGNCQFINPGQFGSIIETASDRTGTGRGLRMEYAFKVYYPLSGLVEHSCLPD